MLLQSHGVYKNNPEQNGPYHHTEYAAIENVKAIDVLRSEIVRNGYFDCHSTVDKWQSKTLFLSSFDPRSSIVKSVFVSA